MTGTGDTEELVGPVGKQNTEPVSNDGTSGRIGSNVTSDVDETPTSVCLYLQHPFPHHEARRGVQEVFRAVAQPGGREYVSTHITCRKQRLATLISLHFTGCFI